MSEAIVEEHTRVRLTGRVLNALAVDVSEHIQLLMQRYETIKSMTLIERPASKGFYLQEGDKNTFFFNGRRIDMEVQAEHNIGVRGLYQDIGAKLNTPVGMLVLNVYYAGIEGYKLRMISYVDEQLPLKG